MNGTLTPPHEPVDVDELAARLRLVTARLARRLRKHTGGGLTPSQQSALACVDVHGPLTLGRLARLEQVAPPTVTRVVDLLERDGLVRRAIDPTDRRHAVVEITPDGRRHMDESRQRRAAWLASRLGTFTAADHRHLRAALPVLEALATADVDEDIDPDAPTR